LSAVAESRDQLAVPLDEFERRHVVGALDRRVVGQHVLQETDPGFADAGLAVGEAQQVRPGRRGQLRNTVSRRKWNAADEVHDGCVMAFPSRYCSPLS